MLQEVVQMVIIVFRSWLARVILNCDISTLQVNQKMMKSTLIKDLYGEIERLKSGNLLLSLLSIMFL